MEGYHKNIVFFKQKWEAYLQDHPTDTIAFAWKSLLGTSVGQKPAKDFPYKNARIMEQN